MKWVVDVAAAGATSAETHNRRREAINRLDVCQIESQLDQLIDELLLLLLLIEFSIFICILNCTNTPLLLSSVFDHHSVATCLFTASFAPFFSAAAAAYQLAVYTAAAAAAAK